MRRWLIIALLSSALAAAQTPPQFTGLLTDSTDYTCTGTVPCATWPMPPLPAYGGSYVDPTWGTTTWRLPIPAANTSGKVIPAYSRVQAWNSDGTLMFMTDLTNAGIDLYDATTTPPTPINVISTDAGLGVYPDAADNDALWAFTDSKRIYFQAGSGTAYGLTLMYVDVSTCTALNCQLHANVVHVFSCATDTLSNPEIGNGVAGNKIETGSGGQGGMFDNTDTYFTFTCDKVDGGGRHVIDFIRYNRLTDTVLHQQKWYTLCPGGIPEGCSAYWYVSKQGRDIVRMNQHQDHHYISILWQSGGSNGTSGTSSPPTHINITGNVLTVTAANTLQVNTEAKFHNLNAATYLNDQFVIVTSSSATQFTAAYTHANDDQAIASGTITGLSCTLDVNWVRGCGLEVFDDDFNFLGAGAPYIGHQDTGFDVNGVPVAVFITSHRGDLPDERALAISDFTHLSTTAITSKRILLPCSYARQPTCAGTFLGAKSGASHISMTGTWGPLKGYGLLSTMIMAGSDLPQVINYPAGTTLGTAVVAPGTVTVTPASMSQIAVGVVSTIDTGAGMESVTWTAVTATTATATFINTHPNTAVVSCLSCGDTGFGSMENVAVKIDTTALDGSNAVFWRIGRTMAIRDNCYNCEPHTSVNRDFTQFIWGSTWNFDPLSSAGPMYGFWTKLATPAVTASSPAVFTGTLTSNSDSTGIVATPARKQLTNCATDYSAGALQPTGVPVGQLYCTAANKTAGEGHGGPVQGVVTATATGTGIAVVTNGQAAGGTDSPSAVLDTYGGSGDDAICTGDANNALPTIISGLPPATCVANSSAVFSETSAIGFPFPDTLWPSDYASNDTALDGACCYYRDTYFQLPVVANVHAFEMDVNLNSSPTAYAAGRGAYFGWGFQYNLTVQRFQYCPQNCPDWNSFRGIDITRAHPDLTTYTLTDNHWYHVRLYGHRTPGCTFTKLVNCFFYDYMTLNDVTAATTPITYKLVDAVTNQEAGGIPVDKHTWASGPDMQVQIDMTTANATAAAHIVSDTTTVYNGSSSSSAGAFWF